MRRGDLELAGVCITLGVVVGLAAHFVLSDHEKGVAGRASNDVHPETPDGPLSSSGADDELTSAYTLVLSTPHPVFTDEVYRPIARRLYSLTTKQWAQEGFCDLNEMQVARLLDNSPDAQGAYYALASGFPTEADCALAVRNPEVRGLLDVLSSQETFRFELESGDATEWPARQVEWQREHRRAIDVTEALLMSKLDEVSTYKSWSAMHKLFKRWSRE